MIKFVFCEDLGAPDLGMILNDEWARANSDEIRATPGIYVFEDRELRNGDIFLIPKEEDKIMFILRWS